MSSTDTQTLTVPTEAETMKLIKSAYRYSEGEKIARRVFFGEGTGVYVDVCTPLTAVKENDLLADKLIGTLNPCIDILPDDPARVAGQVANLINSLRDMIDAFETSAMLPAEKQAVETAVQTLKNIYGTK